MLNLMALTLLAIIVKNPQMIQNFEEAYDDELIPTPVSVSGSVDSIPTPSPVEPQSFYKDHSLDYHDMDMGGLVCLCMIAITLMLIHGTIKGKASHLLPFFFLQLCDFALTTLTAAGYLCYLRTIHNLIEKSNRLPWKEYLIEFDQRSLGIIVLMAFIFMVMLKAYTIGIVWRCYKYLTILQNAALLSYITPPNGNRERSFNSLLPNYEEALSMKINPPPSYQVAMQQQGGTTTSSSVREDIGASLSDSEPPNYSTLDLRQASTSSSPTNSNTTNSNVTQNVTQSTESES